jgi:hypothetical protein
MTSPRHVSGRSAVPFSLRPGLVDWAAGDPRKLAAVDVLLDTSLRDALVHRVGHFHVRPKGYDGPLTWLDWEDVRVRAKNGRIPLWGGRVVLFGVVDWLLGGGGLPPLDGLGVEDRAMVVRVLAGLGVD